MNADHDALRRAVALSRPSADGGLVQTLQWWHGEAKAAADSEGRQRLASAGCRGVKAGPLEEAIGALGGIEELKPMMMWGWAEVAAGRITGDDVKLVRLAFANETGWWASLHQRWLDRPKPKGSSSRVPDEVDGVPLTEDERKAFELELRTADWGHACRNLRWAREERGDG